MPKFKIIKMTWLTIKQICFYVQGILSSAQAEHERLKLQNASNIVMLLNKKESRVRRKMHEWKRKASWIDNAVVKGVFPLKSIPKPSCTCSIQTQYGGNLLTLYVWIQVVLYLDWKTYCQASQKSCLKATGHANKWPELFTVIFLEFSSMTKQTDNAHSLHIYL